jgi:iron complex outermembrane recepter protein
MKPARHALSAAVARALGASMVLAFASGGAVAQQAQKIEKIEVTGSNIKRVDAETALPVTIITRQDIEKMGVVNTEDVIRRVSANTSMFSDTTQGVGYGQSYANLRGIGSNSTLILLNGRRLANHAFSNVGGTASVDLNSIPFNAIERVEVLRDGASAIYGTDAVGGVINFITRTDYRGAEITLKGAMPEGFDNGAGNEYGFNASMGFGDLAKDRWNVLVTGGMQFNKALKANMQKLYNRYIDIDGALDPTSFRGFPGRLADFGFSPGAYPQTDPAFAQCDPEFTVVQNVGPGPAGIDLKRCRGLFPAYLDNLPDQHKADIFGRFTYEFSKDHQLFAELAFARNHTIGRIAPVPIDSSIARIKPDGTQDPFLMPITSRYAPLALISQLGFDPVADAAFPGFLDIIYRAAPAGNRVNDNENMQKRLSAGMKGVVAGWDYNTAFTFARAEDNLTYTGYVHEGRFRDALASGNLNPFGPNDAAGEALLQGVKMEGPMRESTSTTTQIDGKISRELGRLGGGAMGIALGFDLRREKIEDTPVNDDYRQGLHVGGEGTVPNVSADRTVSAVFGEMVFPITRALELSAAVRYDHYDDVGSKTNPRVSMRWQPNPQVLTRASYGTGFRAPSLWDLNSPPAFSNTANQVNDPGCPQALIDAVDPRCVQTQLTTRLSSSPDLKPETSKQWSAGIVLEPRQNFSIALDYWYIEKEDNIGVLTGDTILANPDDLTLYNRFANRFVRNAAGTTLYVDQPAENLGGLKTAGWDLDVRARFPGLGAGTLGMSFAGTYITKYELQNFKDGPFTSYLGNSFNGGLQYPRWTHVAAMDYSTGPWIFTLEQTFSMGWTEAFQDGGTHKIPSVSRINLAMVFQGIRNMKFKLGARNVLDHIPPFTDVSSNGSHAQGWANSVADPRGRVWYGSFTYTFK